MSLGLVMPAPLSRDFARAHCRRAQEWQSMRVAAARFSCECPSSHKDRPGSRGLLDRDRWYCDRSPPTTAPISVRHGPLSVSARNVFSAADRTVALAGSQLSGRPAKARHRNRTHCGRSARGGTRTSGSRRSFG